LFSFSCGTRFFPGAPSLTQQAIDPLREKPLPSAPYGLLCVARPASRLENSATKSKTIAALCACFCDVFGCFLMRLKLGFPFREDNLLAFAGWHLLSAPCGFGGCARISWFAKHQVQEAKQEEAGREL